MNFTYEPNFNIVPEAEPILQPSVDYAVIFSPVIVPPSPPTTLKVIGKTFTVRTFADEEEEDLDGCMRIGTQEILYRAGDRALQYQQDTVLHEVLHAIDEIASIGLGEKKVHQTAALLLAVIKENPGLVNFLIA